MTGIGILVAFLAGIVSFASPCCLPLVPAYVGYMVGTAPEGAQMPTATSTCMRASAMRRSRSGMRLDARLVTTSATPS